MSLIIQSCGKHGNEDGAPCCLSSQLHGVCQHQMARSMWSVRCQFSPAECWTLMVWMYLCGSLIQNSLTVFQVPLNQPWILFETSFIKVNCCCLRSHCHVILLVNICVFNILLITSITTLFFCNFLILTDSLINLSAADCSGFRTL